MRAADIIRDIVKRNVMFDRMPRFLSISSILPDSKCLLAEIHRDASEDAAHLEKWEESIEAARLCWIHYKAAAFSGNPMKVWPKVEDENAYLDASRVFAQRLYAGGCKWIRKACAVGLDAVQQEMVSQRGLTHHGRWNLVFIISDCIVYLVAANRWTSAVTLSQELEIVRTSHIQSSMPSEISGKLHPEFLSSLMQVVRRLIDRHNPKAIQLGEACVAWANIVSPNRSSEEDESYGHRSLHARSLGIQAFCDCNLSMWNEAEQPPVDLVRRNALRLPPQSSSEVLEWCWDYSNEVEDREIST